MLNWETENKRANLNSKLALSLHCCGSHQTQTEETALPRWTVLLSVRKNTQHGEKTQ